MTYTTDTLATRSRHVTARFDPILVRRLCSLIGVVMIYSATKGNWPSPDTYPHYYLKRQAMFLVIGVVVMVAMALFDYRRLEQVSTVLYVGILLALLAVLPPRLQRRGPALVPHRARPAPALEFATLVLIISIATYCARRPEGLEFRDLVRWC